MKIKIASTGLCHKLKALVTVIGKLTNYLLRTNLTTSMSTDQVSIIVADLRQMCLKKMFT